MIMAQTTSKLADEEAGEMGTCAGKIAARNRRVDGEDDVAGVVYLIDINIRPLL